MKKHEYDRGDRPHPPNVSVPCQMCGKSKDDPIHDAEEEDQ